MQWTGKESDKANHVVGRGECAVCVLSASVSVISPSVYSKLLLLLIFNVRYL